MSLSKVISGGQTGVDRAALDAAVEYGIAIGGWIPRGRRAEDGILPAKYAMLREIDPEDEDTVSDRDIAQFYPAALSTETESLRSRLARTRRNVVDSDASLVLTRAAPAGGTAATIYYAQQPPGRPWLMIDLARDPEPARRVLAWLAQEDPAVLNVAGPPESVAPGIYKQARSLLASVFKALRP